ncbi:MAG: hypothetical protein HYU36_01945 [Planctomycetes bacterium]|nr:hypothetical protein [Planctomycetota bacterium]
MPNVEPKEYPWYGIVSGRELEQGDLLFGCPVLEIPRKIDESGEVTSEITVRHQNVVIVTQSCDLTVRDDGKRNVDEVILCPIYFKNELTTHGIFGKNEGWESCRKGRHPGYHLLNNCDSPGHEFEFGLVDLRRVYSLSIGFVEEFAARKGERVRLLPPYREHLSQAFARFFMRVGLPVDIPPFLTQRSSTVGG